MGSHTGPDAVGPTLNHCNSDSNSGHIQACENSNNNFSAKEKDGNQSRDENVSQSIDLNFIPTGGYMEAGDNEDGGVKVKAQKKGICVKSNPISMKLKDIIHTRNSNKKSKKKHGKNGAGASQSSLNASVESVSCEVIKTATIGKEVSFQLDGFEETLRVEIEGEGTSTHKK
ncbi:hypothetical protein L1887_27958 [Cichorium endivia]|nr:hypothetical protein L1887_27958 [Cichorium endivia]